MAEATTRGGSRLARIYAEALMANARKANKVDDVGEELEGVVAAVFGDPGISSFVSSPVVGWRAKEPVFAKALGGRASDLMRNFIGVLNKNGRLGALADIRAAYSNLQDQAADRVRVTVKTAVPLGEAQKQALTSSLQAKLQKQPVLNLLVDPDLLGGIVVQVGDRVMDASVRTRIQSLRAQLMERGSSYVLQN